MRAGLLVERAGSDQCVALAARGDLRIDRGAAAGQPGERVGIPVICVGNPTVGGAGKTPTAIAIARMLIAAGERPMFLSRGYGGRLAGPVTVEAGHTAVQVGDEPLLLARVAPTIVAEDRVAGARLAKEQGASVIVMDDGFQNPSLDKDLSILVVDARGIGNGCVLPAGPLRAPLEPQLDRASALLFVGDGAPAIETAAPRARGLPIFHGNARARSRCGRIAAGEKGSRLRRHRRSGEILRDASLPPGSMPRSGAAFPITTATAPRRRGRSSATPTRKTFNC